MNLNELSSIMNEATTPADPATVEEVKKTEFDEQQTGAPSPTPGNDPEVVAADGEQRQMNLMQFGQIATTVYCSISDLIYKKVKGTIAAPEWSNESKEVMQEAIEGVLSGYNVPMSPIWQLVFTVGAIEVVRYTLLKTVEE